MTSSGNSNIFNKILQQSANEFLVSAERGDIKEFCNLLAVGVDPSTAKGRNDFTALHYAASRGHLAIVQELLHLGVNVDVRTQDGETPLHLAVYSGHMLVVEQLLDHHADINAVNHDNETPLFYASSQGRPLLIRVLLQRGADATVIDNITEDTALARSKDKRTTDMFALMLSTLGILNITSTSSNNDQIAVGGSAGQNPEDGSSSSGSSSATMTTTTVTNKGVAGFLPYSTILLIMRFLETKTICVAGSINSKWYRVSQDNTLWGDNRTGTVGGGGMKRWEYALRHAMGVQPTNTSFLSFNKPRSSGKNNNNSNNNGSNNTNTNKSISRPNSSDEIVIPMVGSGITKIQKKPSSAENLLLVSQSGKMNSQSTIVISNGNTNHISDFF